MIQDLPPGLLLKKASLSGVQSLRSVQVDGGGEFRAEFEPACQTLDIPPFVLPPPRPQLNGCVERANHSARVEFRNLYTGQLTVAALAEAQLFYNDIRSPFKLHTSPFKLPSPIPGPEDTDGVP